MTTNIKFKNSKGEELKTTLSDDIMNQIADIGEEKLKKANIFYKREGTKFFVPANKVETLLQFQEEANKELLQKGILTPEMLLGDLGQVK